LTEWTRAEIDFLRDNYLRFTDRELARILNRSPEVVHRKRLRMGLKKFYDGKRKEPEELSKWIVNNFMNEYRGEWRASGLGSYLIGLILADGSLEDGRCKIWRNNVREDLEFLRPFIPTSKIYETTNKRYCLVVNSKFFVRTLVRYYNVPIGKKSDKIHVPEIFKEVSVKNLPKIGSFLRGFFDGDGTVIKSNQRKKIGIAFYSNSKEFLTEIKNILDKLGIHSLSVNDNKGKDRFSRKPGYVLKVINLFGVLSFYNLLYVIPRFCGKSDKIAYYPSVKRKFQKSLITFFKYKSKDEGCEAPVIL